VIACADLVPFADGELDRVDAAAFSLHLSSCASCREGLVDALRMSARLSTLDPAAELARIKSLIREWADAADAMAGAEPELARFNRARRALRGVVTRNTTPKKDT
jgi:sugar/nucleoside kinase (ribokinase family)